MTNVTEFQLLQKKMVRCKISVDWTIVTEEDTSCGSLFPVLCILRALFCQLPEATMVIMRHHAWFVVESCDTALIEASLKVLRLEFSYKPAISAHQFSREGQFASQRIKICSDLLTFLFRVEEEERRGKRMIHPSRSPPLQKRAGRIAPVVDPTSQRIEQDLKHVALRHRALNRVFREPQEQADKLNS